MARVSLSARILCRLLFVLGNDRLDDGADSVPVIGDTGLCEIDQKVAAPLTCS